MADHSSIGRKSKNKGKRYEAKIAKLFTEITGVNFRRVPASGGFNKCGGVHVASRVFCGDLICDNADFIFSVEAKNRKIFDYNHIIKNVNTAPFTAWWFQCVRDAYSNNLLPLMIFNAGTHTDVVVVDEYTIDLFDIQKFSSYNAYNNDLSFTVIEKFGTDKKAVKHHVVARLPMPHLVYVDEFCAAIKSSSMVFDQSVISKHPNTPLNINLSTNIIKEYK